MGYPPQYPPQYYAPPQQPQYVTEDEVAQIVENAINEKLQANTASSAASSI